MKSTATSSQGTYRVTESESESEPSDKFEPVQQLKDFSNPVSKSVLSPLTGLSLIAEGKSREPDPGPPKPPKKEVDPFDAEFDDALYITTIGDQDLILGLPWLEKHNLIIDWKEKTLEFRSSSEDKVKAFIWSLAQRQGETALIKDEDLVVRDLKSHRGPEPSDQLYTPFEDIGRWNEEEPDTAIRKYSPAQQMEHKYNTEQEESILPTQYLPWKEVFEQKAAE